jgi:DNA-binding MarR family transcriptional regulator
VATPDYPLQVEETTDIIGYRLRRAQLKVFQRFIADFESLNIRPAEFSVLVLIDNNPGRKQTEIADVLGIKRANFVALINRLESRGLTERRVAAGNRRANALHLTPAGARLLKEIRDRQATFEARCIKELGGIEARDALFALLDKLGG